MDLQNRDAQARPGPFERILRLFADVRRGEGAVVDPYPQALRRARASRGPDEADHLGDALFHLRFARLRASRPAANALGDSLLSLGWSLQRDDGGPVLELRQ